MNLKELTTRLQKGEDLHSEFKEWPIHSDDLAASIVAFTNTDGCFVRPQVMNLIFAQKETNSS